MSPSKLSLTNFPPVLPNPLSSRCPFQQTRTLSRLRFLNTSQALFAPQHRHPNGRYKIHKSRIRPQPQPQLQSLRVFSTTSPSHQPFSPFSLPTEIANTLFPSSTSSNTSQINPTSSISSPSATTIHTSHTLPDSPSSSSHLFHIISNIGAYPTFLPFLTSASIHSRDPTTNLPTRATLTVGYNGLTESFTSLVRCDPEAGTVEAWSGRRGMERYEEMYGNTQQHKGDEDGDKTAEESVFEELYTKWQLTELDNEGEERGEGAKGAKGRRTKADLTVAVQFKNPIYNQILRVTEGKIAEKIAEGFLSQVRKNGEVAGEVARK